MPSLVVNTNTWVTLAEADSYLEERLGADAWVSVSDTNKIQCLITAFRWINRDPNYTISVVTNSLKWAQIVLAWYVYNNLDEHEKRAALYNQGVRKFIVSRFHETLVKGGLPEEVKDLLTDYAYNAGGYLPVIEREIDENA